MGKSLAYSKLILGVISQAGFIDMSLKKPQAVSAFKKRKANDTTATVISSGVGIRSETFSGIFIQCDGCTGSK